MITYQTKRNNEMVLKAVYEGSQHPVEIGERSNYITELFKSNEAYIFISKEVKTYTSFLKVVDSIVLAKRRNYQIDLDSFVNDFLTLEDVVRAFVLRIAYHEAKLYHATKKIDKDEEKIELSLLISSAESIKVKTKISTLIERLNVIATAINGARNWQITPPNIATSTKIAEEIEAEFSKNPDLKVTVLKKKDLQKLNMNLVLAVNAASADEARVVVVEYKGNPDSKEKTVYVGKGICFDTGGYNTKGYHMEDMKFDMSGSVICAYAVKALAELKVAKNAAAVMLLTDNKVDANGTVPESVIISMSGKSVEITDTDAEGRLVLADGLYYAATELKATTIVDVATLTGAMTRALGKTYSGIYATSDEKWTKFESSAKIAHEKVWRMPMHEAFHKPNKSSKVADLNNYSTSELSDCNTAAMFLKEFTNNVDYIHCDIAGTADGKGMGYGVLVSTLVEFGELI
ncbi:Cytosol aminopeptidase [Metamycoplasma cloacale]|uniref:Probable cytosol aminopeptidase n=1 Tax=Metamycoplasma cloacale TaxID=92401 RepID=A0A2Z4LN01_9BACT|nr:leucyl aminopeptidase family protein [Metamycoplasma cloacale]AWX42617.1 leucyl aminopeptidase family protein [Metamycoplasma cloacale]VEU79628.1 Cytosol aminopeptidase [Metamycoplasma cloacale]